MPEIKQVTIGDVSYNIGQAYAKKQKTLLTLVGAGCAINSAAFDVEEIDEKYLMAFLLSMSEEKLDQVTDIVFSRTFKTGEDRAVCVDDFQGRMSEFLKLVAFGVRHNLNDFFEYLDCERAEARPAKNPIAAA